MYGGLDLFVQKTPGTCSLPVLLPSLACFVFKEQSADLNDLEAKRTAYFDTNTDIFKMFTARAEHCGG